jgi:hypothetical protein
VIYGFLIDSLYHHAYIGTRTMIVLTQVVVRIGSFR